MDADADAWGVLLIGGASGVGKSRVSYPLARELGMPVLETDDLVIAIKAATTPEQLPLVHYWDTHPQAQQWPAHRIAELAASVNGSLEPVFDAVIADHLDTGVRIIMEGDHLVPTLAAGRAGVRGVIVHETDVEQLVCNYLDREPDAGQQRLRAEVSALHSAQLAEQAAALGVPVITARPWASALRRAATALGLTDGARL